MRLPSSLLKGANGSWAAVESEARLLRSAATDPAFASIRWFSPKIVDYDQENQILATELPDVYISLSAEVAPVMGEYERSATALFNAYVGPVIESYGSAGFHIRVYPVGLANLYNASLSQLRVGYIADWSSLPSVSVSSTVAQNQMAAQANVQLNLTMAPTTVPRADTPIRMEI